MGSNLLNFINAKQFDQSTTTKPFTFKVEGRTDVKVDVKATAPVGPVDVTAQNTTTTNTSNGQTTNESKVVVGKEGNGVLISNKTTQQPKKIPLEAVYR